VAPKRRQFTSGSILGVRKSSATVMRFCKWCSNRSWTPHCGLLFHLTLNAFAPYLVK